MSRGNDDHDRARVHRATLATLIAMQAERSPAGFDGFIVDLQGRTDRLLVPFRPEGGPAARAAANGRRELADLLQLARRSRP